MHSVPPSRSMQMMKLSRRARLRTTPKCTLSESECLYAIPGPAFNGKSPESSNLNLTAPIIAQGMQHELFYDFPNQRRNPTRHCGPSECANRRCAPCARKDHC